MGTLPRLNKFDFSTEKRQPINRWLYFLQYAKISLARLIDKFSDLKHFNVGEETKIYRPQLKERSKISTAVKFHGEIL